MKHTPVLLNEILEGLDTKNGDIILDMTLGGGGHLSEIARLSDNLTLIGVDADYEAEARFKEKSDHDLIFINSYFDDIDSGLKENGISKVDRVLFDLGYSSYEIDSLERGFSFLHDGPLKMTYTQNPSTLQLTAYDVVNSFKEESLADIIYGFGEERYARRIAKAIVTKREEKEIKTTLELAEIVKSAVPYKNSKVHPATKTFQAIRIAVNSELERLKIALRESFERLNSEGRIAVISFHSLEDRIVKKYFRELKDQGVANLITKKPITPSTEEVTENPRSRSAKLRIIEKI